MKSALIPIADRLVEYAFEIRQDLLSAGLQTGVDIHIDRMQAKIRDAQNRKVPYMLVIGDKEAASGQVSLRARSAEDLGAMPSEKFLAKASKDIEELS